MTSSQQKTIDRINDTNGWSCEEFGEPHCNGAITLRFKNDKEHVFLGVSGLMVVGKRGKKEIIGMNIFTTDERKERRKQEKTHASLFCFDVFGYGTHPKIKLI